MSRFPTELRRWRTARRLSQMELATRAGTTQRHVSFVELGRSRPGRNVVMRLAELLDLTLRERNDLLISAGFAPAFPESPLDDAALRPIREALDRILDGHLPYQALVVRPHGILVTANRAFELFHEDVDPALLAPPVNLFRLALHPDGVAARVRNLPAWSRHIFSPGRLLAVQSTTRAGPRLDRRPRGCRGSAPRRASTPSRAWGRGTCLEELQLYVLRVATERQEPAVALVAVERLIPLHGLVHVGHHAHDELIKAFPNVPLPAGQGSDVDLHRSDGGKATSLRDR